MTLAAVFHSALRDSSEAGAEAGAQVLNTFQGHSPDALVLFASSSYDYVPLLRSLDATCHPRLLVGCSSAGEFTSDARGEGSISGLAFRSDEIKFAAGLGRGLRAGADTAASELLASFNGVQHYDGRFRTGLVLADALAGHLDLLIERLTVKTQGRYQFFGGGAGDDGHFRQTHVFYGTEAFEDAAVGLELVSRKAVGIGVAHGWQPASEPFRVTEATGMCLTSLNARPAAEAFAEHAERTGQRFRRDDPLPFFLHNVIGIDTGGGHRLRVPLAINADASVLCAAEIPPGSTVRIMGIGNTASPDAAVQAASEALHQLGDNRPAAALFFDCVATRLRLGKEFDLELSQLQEALGSTKFAGCNSYGQIARAEGQFSGFHNCTAVIGIIPE